MIEITAKTTAEKVRQDYTDNFMPRKEIGLRLGYEEIAELVQDASIQTDGWFAWHFQFYLKQLLKLSWEIIDTNTETTSERKTQLIQSLRETVTFASRNQTRALVAFIWVTFFIKEISNHDLYAIFSGHTIYDDHCAQVAYEEYLRRKSAGLDS